MYPTRLDEKGRLKLPTGFQPFFTALREKTLFVTSFDRKMALIFPMAVWRLNEEVFAKAAESAYMRKLAFNAADFGAESEMDNQGRILFPPELRRGLGLETGTLRIYAHKGKFNVLSDQLYNELRDSASQLNEQDLEQAAAAGLIL